MLKDDAQLIRSTLLGDDTAFATLVEKYQKGVHALIWRKIGDFHHAEEIAQDTFLQAYKKLGTLKDPNSFAGWLYVIANRLSINWLQRSKPKTETQSLEGTSVVEIEESSYTHYMSDQREAEVKEHRSEVVKKLLERLPESERTVVTLHFLGEMTTKEIGKFLGVSVNTIKSRLRRGRERLKAAESLVHEVLGGVQLSPELTERIMRQVAEINPIVPPVGKPTVPWMALGAAAVLVLLMLGVGNQYLARFQRPYSFEARSEPTVEIVEAPIVIDILSKPTLRKQFGRSPAPGKSIGAGTQISEATLRSNAQEDRRKFSTAQWTQGNSPPGGYVNDIFATSEGSVFAISPTGMYRLASNATAWTRINVSLPMSQSMVPMVEDQGILYVVSADEIFASTDNGQTWNLFCTRPEGNPVGLIVIDEVPAHGSHVDVTMYLALEDEGIFRSTDSGKQWTHLNEGLTGERISAVAAVEKNLFAGTNSGLHRLDSDIWRKLPVGMSNTVYSLAASGKSLYVGMGPDMFELTPQDRKRKMDDNESNAAQIFRSRNLGTSWTEVTPKSTSSRTRALSGVKLLAVGETLLALGITRFRSTDGGETWTELEIDAGTSILNSFPGTAVDERTFYKAGIRGVHRTTDAGESWDLFMDGMTGTRAISLVSLNNTLYTHTANEVFQSMNGGRSWKSLRFAAEEVPSESVEQNASGIKLSFDSKLLVSGNTLYLLVLTGYDLRIFRLSTDGNLLIPLQGLPTFDDERLSLGLETGSQEDEHSRFSEILLDSSERSVKNKTLAVSRGVFYAEYKRRLFKWRLGDPEWKNTGLIDTSEVVDEDAHAGFKIAVSGETVYVGKRDGKLFRSVDGGSNWRDITSNLPLDFAHFKEIVFSGSTLYVATDKGILVSETGEYWRVGTDRTDTRVVINQFALDGTEVYGIADTGVYQLNTRGHWEQVSSEVPDGITSLTITNGRLYGAAEERGIFNMPLEDTELRANAE
ncbi:sigma-70 family RNA polymerase sigma factor [Candidatus Poribacteria bacterium]|nr:sigma-70 family RNA polymerase sigma factor [Candidatus Poribacteria bacterium]